MAAVVAERHRRHLAQDLAARGEAVGTMMVMVSNQTNATFRKLAIEYPRSLGHLFSPGGDRIPSELFPHSYDNDAWSCHLRGIAWREGPWHDMLHRASCRFIKPLWALVPDVVADRKATLERWERYLPAVRARGFRPAFALQDGMTFDDVPTADCMLFLGGSTAWKLAAIEPWCSRFPGRVHVARVNHGERLWKCYRAGAVSVDGTGWWHNTHKRSGDAQTQLEELIDFVQRTGKARRAA